MASVGVHVTWAIGAIVFMFVMLVALGSNQFDEPKEKWAGLSSHMDVHIFFKKF